jgi:hypothetical protein
LSSKILRALAIAGGLAFVAEGALELAHHQHEHFTVATDYLIEAAFAAGLLLTLAGLLAVHLRQERDLGAVGVWAFRIAIAGQGALGVVALATLARGQDALGPLFPLAVVAWAAGTIAYAVATARARVLPAWLAPALAFGTLVGIALNPGGTILLGALWLTLSATVAVERYPLRPATA